MIMADVNKEIIYVAHFLRKMSDDVLFDFSHL